MARTKPCEKARRALSLLMSLMLATQLLGTCFVHCLDRAQIPSDHASVFDIGTNLGLLTMTSPLGLLSVESKSDTSPVLSTYSPLTIFANPLLPGFTCSAPSRHPSL